jgi:RNA polymerase nonessential primary-like sigma factor
MSSMAGHPFTALSADDEDSYRLQIAGLPRLSSEEEQRLLATRGQAREAANKRLIEHNLDLVFEAAYARRDRGVPFGDLFQEGTVGLISAVEHYRAPAERFRASLRTAIAAVMDDILAQTADAQRNDEAFVKACRLLETAQRLLAGRLQRPATTAELAKLLRWEEDRVLVIQEMLDGARTIHDRELLDYLDDLEARDDEAG